MRPQSPQSFCHFRSSRGGERGKARWVDRATSRWDEHSEGGKRQMEFILPLRSYWLIKGHSNRASSAAHVASSPPTTAIRRGRRETPVGMHRPCAVWGLRPTSRRHVAFVRQLLGARMWRCRFQRVRDVPVPVWVAIRKQAVPVFTEL